MSRPRWWWLNPWAYAARVERERDAADRACDLARQDRERMRAEAAELDRQAAHVMKLVASLPIEPGALVVAGDRHVRIAIPQYEPVQVLRRTDQHESLPIGHVGEASFAEFALNVRVMIASPPNAGRQMNAAYLTTMGAQLFVDAVRQQLAKEPA